MSSLKTSPLRIYHARFLVFWISLWFNGFGGNKRLPQTEVKWGIFIRKSREEGWHIFALNKCDEEADDDQKHSTWQTWESVTVMCESDVK
jgi:hypothetical protein